MATNTKDYYSRPDGEYFTDEGVKQIPPADTWDNLSVNQLLEVQSYLYDKLWTFRSNPLMNARLQEGINRVQALISLRNSGA